MLFYYYLYYSSLCIFISFTYAQNTTDSNNSNNNSNQTSTPFVKGSCFLLQNSKTCPDLSGLGKSGQILFIFLKTLFYTLILTH